MEQAFCSNVIQCEKYVLFIVTVRNFHFSLNVSVWFKYLISGLQVAVLQISSLQITSLQSIVCTEDSPVVVLWLLLNLLLPFLGFGGPLSAENFLGGFCVMQSRQHENCSGRLAWVIKWWWVKLENNFLCGFSKIKQFPELGKVRLSSCYITIRFKRCEVIFKFQILWQISIIIESRVEFRDSCVNKNNELAAWLISWDVNWTREAYSC